MFRSRIPCAESWRPIGVRGRVRVSVRGRARVRYILIHFASFGIHSPHTHMFLPSTDSTARGIATVARVMVR